MAIAQNEVEGYPVGMRIECAAVCDRGPVRPENQDRFVVTDFETAHSEPLAEKACLGAAGSDILMAVADGMGGAAGGALAAETALEALVVHWLAHESGRPPMDVLSDAFETAHAAVRAKAGEEGLEGMGTTMTAALVRKDTLYVAHVGDTRAYLFRMGELTSLTTDHSYWTKLQGYDDDAARRQVGGNMLVQCVGGISPSVFVEATSTGLCYGDQIILCSDGLHGVVDKDTIEKRFRAGGLNRAVWGLRDDAVASGTQDNITVVGVQLGDEDLPEAVAGEVLRIERIAEVLYDPQSSALRRD